MNKFMAWLKGKSRIEFLENLSYTMFVIAAICVAVGILFGSFYKYWIMLASFGAFLILPGIVIYIISQLLEK